MDLMVRYAEFDELPRVNKMRRTVSELHAARLREASCSSYAAFYTYGSLTPDMASHEVRIDDVQVQVMYGCR